MNYSERDLPVVVRETEMVSLEAGAVVRYEESGGARDVFVGDEWESRASLFPGMSYELECVGCTYLLSAMDEGLKVERKP
ncbi:hypothetical protein N1030_02090 [Desulfovibrio mangrovi]|uniref:hypothetical protein n=1 Tax=Desulfovibrio mangrovi TaxID=2976983 RepID=UPI002247FB6E|nr:hypothetical protein [Desulfovibrio mangrovi]UZP67785.1 hypothetical protein N1030_02090 [Desulfovibrio mangrovi]